LKPIALPVFVPFTELDADVFSLAVYFVNPRNLHVRLDRLNLC
jgi:hypothetical protein